MYILDVNMQLAKETKHFVPLFTKKIFFYCSRVFFVKILCSFLYFFFLHSSNPSFKKNVYIGRGVHKKKKELLSGPPKYVHLFLFFYL